MRIRNIIIDSVLLPFKNYKLFIITFMLAFICENISEKVYTTNLGQLSIAMMIIDTTISLIILGMMMNITYRVVYNEKIEFNPRGHLIEGIKEYIVTLYYIILTFITSSLFIIPTGAYMKITHINEYISKMDINTTFMTLHELSHQLPVNLHINLQHSIQLNAIIAIMLFIFFTSMGFIGKILLHNTGKISYALDFRKIFIVINNIGVTRYLKFLLCIAIVTIFVFNSVVLLEYFFKDIVISSILESFTLIFSTNAFYSIYFK